MIHLFSKRTDSSGFSDEELRAAAQAVRNSMLQSLEEAAEPHHTFSEFFLRRMQELLRLDQRRNSRRRILQRAAVFLLGVFISGALFLAFNSEARAEFTHWIRRSYENSIFYEFFSGESNPSSNNSDVLPNVEFTWLPRNYKFYESCIDAQNKVVTLVGDEDTLILHYWATDAIGFIEIRSSDYIKEEAVINEQKADYYHSTKVDSDSVLVWTDTTTNIVFNLFSKLPKEDMIRIAEGIKEN